MVGDVGAIVGPVVAGMVVDWSGYPMAFALTAAVVAVALASWHRATETVVPVEARRRVSKAPSL
jgi:hypothetical protein